MKNQKENKDVGFTLNQNRVFEYVKDGKADLIIANKDFTNFRTLDQLINMNGNVDVKVIDVDQMVKALQKLEKEFKRSLRNNLILSSINECLDEKHISSKKYEEYKKLKAERDAKYETIIGDANKYLKAVNLKINIDGSVSIPEDDTGNAYTLLNRKRTLYFLSSGELLKESKGPKFSYVANTPYRSPYFFNLNDLIEYKKEVQEDYYKEIETKLRKKETEENNQKYLEF